MVSKSFDSCGAAHTCSCQLLLNYRLHARTTITTMHTKKSMTLIRLMPCMKRRLKSLLLRPKSVAGLR